MTRILFIDDDVLSLQLMSKATNLLGYQAITSSSPNRGLTLALREKPSLILVDMQMDEMDGGEFVRQVRSLPGISGLPVLICSAGSSNWGDEEAKKVGADGYLTKPVGLAELSKVIATYAQA